MSIDPSLKLSTRLQRKGSVTIKVDKTRKRHRSHFSASHCCSSTALIISLREDLVVVALFHDFLRSCEPVQMPRQGWSTVQARRLVASHQGSASAVEQVAHQGPSIFQATSEGPSRITGHPARGQSPRPSSRGSCVDCQGTSDQIGGGNGSCGRATHFLTCTMR